MMRTAWWFVIVLGADGAADMQPQPESADAEAAMIAVLAARASLLDVIPNPRAPIRFGGEAKVLSPEEAAAALVRMSKPVWCEALGIGGLPNIDCRTLTGPIRDSLAKQQAFTRRFVENWVEEHVGSVALRDTIAVGDGTTSVLVSFEGLLRWVRDYDGRWAFALELPDRSSPNTSRFVVMLAPGEGTIRILGDSLPG